MIGPPRLRSKPRIGYFLNGWASSKWYVSPQPNFLCVWSFRKWRIGSVAKQDEPLMSPWEAHIGPPVAIYWCALILCALLAQSLKCNMLHLDWVVANISVSFGSVCTRVCMKIQRESQKNTKSAANSGSTKNMFAASLCNKTGERRQKW